MPAPRVVIEVTASAGTATVVVNGELDAVTAPLLARRLAPVLAHRPERLVFDLAGVGYIDCAAARLIVGTGRVLPAGGRPVILHPSPAVRRMLELTGLEAYFEAGGLPGPC